MEPARGTISRGTIPLLVVVVVGAAPSAARSEPVVLELTPGAPPTPVVLPPGVSADEVAVELLDDQGEAEDPTPQPAIRTYYVAGYPVEVERREGQSPVRVHAAEVGGEQVLLVGADGSTAEPRPVRARLVTRGAGGIGPLPSPAPDGWEPALPEPEPILAIVTTGAIVRGSELFERYVAWREAGGLTVVVGTEEDWNVPVAEGPDRRPDRIRAWLRELRDERGLGYVLLIGDPTPIGGSVPMQVTHPMSALIPYYPSELAAALDPVPTDHYYAELDDDWDLDGDGRLGEYPDDAGEGGLGWKVDALVGRIPVYGNDASHLDAVLEAVIAYESDGAPGYRHRVLLPAAFLGFRGSPAPGGGAYEETADGAAAAASVFDTVLALNARAEPIRLFEEEGIRPTSFDHELPLSSATLLSEWADGAGFVVLYGHGSTDGVYRTAWLGDWDEDRVPDWSELLGDPFLTSRQTRDLAEVGRAFTFHAACETGWPEDPGNLSTALLRRGAIASVAASRAAIGGEAEFEPDPGLGDADTLAYAFVHLLLEGATAGQALAYLRYGIPADDWGAEMGIPLNGYGWLGKLEYNLYGDPVVALGLCDDDADCDDGSLCNGPGRCVEGYCAQGELVDCSDAGLDGQCTVARCEPDTAACGTTFIGDGTSCDDGLYCTVDDACGSGECAGTTRDCGEPPPGFSSACDEASRACVLVPLAGDDDEEDGDAPRGAPFTAGGGCTAVAAPGRALGLLRLFL